MGEIGLGRAALQPLRDEGCELLGFGLAEPQARLGADHSEQRGDRLGDLLVRHRHGLLVSLVLVVFLPPSRVRLRLVGEDRLVGLLGGEGGSFEPVLWKDVSTTGGRFTGDRTGGTRQCQLRGVVDVGLGDDRAVRHADLLDPVEAGLDQLLQSLADSTSALGAGVGHVPAVLAPAVRAGEEVRK